MPFATPSISFRPPEMSFSFGTNEKLARAISRRLLALPCASPPAAAPRPSRSGGTPLPAAPGSPARRSPPPRDAGPRPRGGSRPPRRRGRRRRPPLRAARDRSAAARRGPRRHPNRGAVDDQLVPRGPRLLGGHRSEPALGRCAVPAPARSRTSSPARLPRPVPDGDRGTLSGQCPDRRPRRSTGPEDECASSPSTGPGSAASRPVASVFAARMRPSAKLSVLAAPISCAARGLVRHRQGRLLVRNRHVDPDEAIPGQRTDQLRESSGLHVDGLIAPLVGQAELRECGGLHRRRAGVRDRMPKDGEPVHARLNSGSSAWRGRIGRRRRAG